MSCSVNPDVLRTRFQSQIIALLDLQTIVPKLSEAGLLTRAEQEKLLNPLVGREERIANLVLWLGSKGKDCVARFISCLRSEDTHLGHAVLVKVIENGLQDDSAALGLAAECSSHVQAHTLRNNVSSAPIDATTELNAGLLMAGPAVDSPTNSSPNQPPPTGTDGVADLCTPPPKQPKLQDPPCGFELPQRVFTNASHSNKKSVEEVELSTCPALQVSPGGVEMPFAPRTESSSNYNCQHIVSEYQQLLQDNTLNCMRLIDLKSLFPHLMKYGLLTGDQAEHLLNEHFTANERIVNLLEFMKSKGEQGMILFIRAIGDEKEHMGHIELHHELTSNKPSLVVPLTSLIQCVKHVYSQPTMLSRATGPKLNVAKYINLALIKKRKVRLSDKEAYKYMMKTLHKTVDDIPELRKDPIELSDIFNYGAQCVKRVLVEGAPGIGKAVLATHLCSEWAAGRLLQEYDCVILVYLRQFHRKVFATSERDIDVVDLVNVYVRGENGHKASEALIETRGRKTLLILEGWDELPPELRDEFSFFSQIISGNVLPECSVMVTSRPSVSSQLYHMFKRRIEILGFTEEKIKEYIVEHATEQQDSILAYLKIHPNIKRFAYVPQTLSIICKIVKRAGELPLTLTELYGTHIRNKLAFNLKKHPRFKNIPSFQSFEDLPDEARRVLHALGQLALDGFVDKNFVFQVRDLRDVCLEIDDIFDGYGLLNLFLCYDGADYQVSYQFQHLTVQEYMAAYRLQRVEHSKRVELINEFRNDPQFEVVLKFFSGVSRLEDEQLQELVIDRTRKYDNHDEMVLLHCIFEARNTKLCERAAKCLDRRLELSNKLLTPTDCLAIAHLIGQTGGDWYLELRNCSVKGEGLEILQYHLKEFQSQRKSRPLTIEAMDLSCNNLDMSVESDPPVGLVLAKFINTGFKLVEIDISSNRKFGDEGTRLVAAALKNNKHVMLLQMNICNITDVGGGYLADMLRSNKALVDLFVRWNSLGDKGVSYIASALCINDTLKYLSVGDNSVKKEGWRNLCEMLKRNKTLKCIRIEGSCIDADGCTELVDAFPMNRTLTRIDFLKNPLGDSGVKTLANGLISNPTCVLKHLGLFGCSITDEVKSVCRLIEANRLSGVQLGCNPGITDIGAQRLTEALKLNTSLKQLRLEKTAISEEGKELLSGYCSSVLDITYSDNTHVEKMLKERRRHKSMASHSSF